MRALLGSRLLKASFLTRLACAKLALNRRPVDEVMVAEVFGGSAPVPRPAFRHAGQVSVPGAPTLLGCYHVSQQNTFTGRLTPRMLDEVLTRAVALADQR